MEKSAMFYQRSNPQLERKKMSIMIFVDSSWVYRIWICNSQSCECSRYNLL